MSGVSLAMAFHMVELEKALQSGKTKQEEAQAESLKRIECLEARIRILEAAQGAKGTDKAGKAWF
ncbi:hypothetical protein HDU67_002307 [Dinochytrium kinnereticum]|nr:hypothetical protein HDU67_002307 [Dinochytrium kinnereticum]